LFPAEKALPTGLAWIHWSRTRALPECQAPTFYSKYARYRAKYYSAHPPVPMNAAGTITAHKSNCSRMVLSRDEASHCLCLEGSPSDLSISRSRPSSNGPFWQKV
jgi:hypothetical protein